jgi:cytochrome c-type biogenesis protein CcmH/NrfG
MNSAFWFAAGVLTGATAVAVTAPLWRGIGASLAGRRRTYAMAAGGLVVFACAAALLYLLIGSPHSSVKQVTAEAPHPASGDPASGAKALSMEAATARLEARLQRDGGSDADWQLLAQSYDFLGRPDDAARARARMKGGSAAQTPSNGSPSGAAIRPLNAGDISSLASLLNDSARPASVGTSAGPSNATSANTTTTVDSGDTGPSQTELEQRVKRNPRDAQSWLALAEWHRRKHELDGAQSAYEKLTGLNAMTAQSWADYADVLGTRAQGSLAGPAGRAIDHALELDPTHPKALWLDATRALQEHRYDDALGTWRRLRGELEAGSPDAQLVDANIAEAQQLARSGPVAATDRGGNPQTNTSGTARTTAATGTASTTSALDPTPGASPASAVEISGTVSIESRLASRVNRDATLFIYAKAADSPGPPLAVVRLAANSLPVSFRLDDSMAMIPSRRLSQFQRVVVEARISRTGQATPAAGDLYVTSTVLSPGSGKKLALVINHEIG